MATTKFNHSGTTNQADTISSLLAGHKGDNSQAEVVDLIVAGIQLLLIKEIKGKTTLFFPNSVKITQM